MSTGVKHRRCTGCKKQLPDAEFTAYERGVRDSLCRPCRSSRRARNRWIKRFIKGYTELWTWSKALCKMIKNAAPHRWGPNSYDKQLDQVSYEILYDLQNGRCALSGLKLCVPENPLPEQTGLKAWSAHLPPKYKLHVADVVRIVDTERLAEGNMMLVCSMFAPIYEACGSFSAFTSLIPVDPNHKFTTFSADIISQHRVLREIKNKEELRQHLRNRKFS